MELLKVADIVLIQNLNALKYKSFHKNTNQNANRKQKYMIKVITTCADFIKFQ